jgi:acetyl/propionyl-CoA carboxylase alpha subunit
VKKVLVANRGEIACRIIRTLDRMGIASVAVYSEPDSQARHVHMAGESVCLGPAPAAQSYLRTDAILDAAKRLGVDATSKMFHRFLIYYLKSPHRLLSIYSYEDITYKPFH